MPDDPEIVHSDPTDLLLEIPPSPPEPTPPLAPREIWTLRDLLLFIAFVPFAFLVSDVLILVDYSALKPLMGWHTTTEAAQSNTLFLLAMQSIFYTLLLGFLVVLSKVQHGQPFWRALGWKQPTLKQVLRWVLGGVGLAILAGLALLIHPDNRSFPLEEMFNSRSASIALGAFAVAIAPVVEEVVFRGLLFAVCERALGLSFAVIASAGLFGALHISEYWPVWNHIVVIFLVGLVFSLARARSGALTPSIFMHIGYNSLMILGFFSGN